MDLAIIAARIVQFAAATALFGAPLFLLYGLRAPDRAALGWPRPALSAAALALAAGTAAGLLAQTAAMAGDPAAAFDPGTLRDAAVGTPFGIAMLVRGLAAIAALVLCRASRPGSLLWVALSGLGAVALASFAWTGHGAATEGPGALPHLVSDVLHLLAAGVWLGALAALAILLRPRRTPAAAAELQAIRAALAGFSGIGSAVVAVIVLTGLVNGWFLVGPSRVLDMAHSAYGVLLLAKLGLFIGMLGLAAANRFRLTPALARGLVEGRPAHAIAELRQSLLLETAAGLAILVLVGILGTLAPVAAQ